MKFTAKVSEHFKTASLIIGFSFVGACLMLSGGATLAASETLFLTGALCALILK